MKLYDKGVYLVNGAELVEDTADASAVLKAKTGAEITPEQAKTQTIAYHILQQHNTSGNMEKLQIKFDKLTSHDITFVGIIQTARASGLEKFPIPYVLTNCHNSLQLTRMTICLGCPARNVMVGCMCLLIRLSSISLPERCLPEAGR